MSYTSEWPYAGGNYPPREPPKPRKPIKTTELEKAGDCTGCGTYAEYRNTAGQCNECHNAGNAQRRAEMKAANLAAREEGRKYWAARGVRVGETVYSYARSMLGFGGISVSGTAKVGAVGAFVSSRYQKGYLSPDSFKTEDGR